MPAPDDEVGAPPSPTAIDIELHREGARRELALILLAILATEVVIGLISQLGTNPGMKDMIAVIFGPTVALVGSALGFYYGTKPDTK